MSKRRDAEIAEGAENDWSSLGQVYPATISSRNTVSFPDNSLHLYTRLILSLQKKGNGICQVATITNKPYYMSNLLLFPVLPARSAVRKFLKSKAAERQNRLEKKYRKVRTFHEVQFLHGN